MKKIILVLAFLPMLAMAQTKKPLKNALKDVHYGFTIYSGNENNIQQNAIQLSLSKPIKNQMVSITITGQRVREFNQLATHDISFNVSLSGKSKK